MSDSDPDISDIDSDTELQRAFSEGRLKVGLNRLKDAVPEPKKAPINNVAGMQQKLKEMQTDLAWIERLDVSVEPTARLETEDDVNDDFKRELIFYHQAQDAVRVAIPRLHKLGVVTKRPEDYFAEMAKPDYHMKKIREKLMEKKTSMERSEAAKKLRAAKKFGKKVQQEVTLARQQQKRELSEAVKKYRKGKANNLDEILDGSAKKNQQPNKKRQHKDRKYGFGGQKKRGKRNTKESVDQGWSKAKPSAARSKGKQKSARPGKTKRTQMKNRKK
ncbi:probable rRNA-processing protein EBP2 [Littorina saxatilis]|uniref:Uncharacterized protein n=1 Tax=Littorina saxatilis TaxID=31220 RepID=A0AAN9GA57_9CAEN